MNKVIGVTDLQRNFRVVFDEVAQQKTPYILTRDSRPEAVMVPYDEWLQQQDRLAGEVWSRLDATLARLATLNANVSEAQVEADIKAATRAVRARKRQAKATGKRAHKAKRRA